MNVAEEPVRPAETLASKPRRAGFDHVQLGGWVRTPLRLGAPALESFGAVTVPGFLVVCTLDGAHGQPRPLRGVPLRKLVAAAEPAFAQRTDFKRVVIVAESREGYRALFSWNELFNSMLGDGVLLAWDCVQAPLADNAGPFALVSLHDHATGPRYVQRLASIELHKLW
ncbi:MAG: hypothetical protein QM722_19015 [Piscinibacter sp.]